MSKIRFTGGDNLTGFEKLLNDMYMVNELKNGYGAYEISHAQKGNSRLLKNAHMLCCTSPIGIATYAKIRLTSLDLRALPLGIFEQSEIMF